MKVLIVVDMQEDFIDGALGTAEAAGIVDAVVTRIQNSTNELVLFTKDTHQQDYLDTPEGKHLPVIHCVEGTPGWEINSRIMDAWKNNPNTIRLDNMPDNVFTKPVFGSVNLVKFLESRKTEIEEIEILGVCTDICVVSNAIMIKNTLPNITLKVNSTCCAGVTPKTHNEAISVMKMCQIEEV